MALLLGIGEFSLPYMLQTVAKPPINYASKALAQAAALPPMASNQVGVFVTVKIGANTELYFKTADGMSLIVQS